MAVLTLPEFRRFDPARGPVRRVLGSTGRNSVSLFDRHGFVTHCSLLVVLAWRGLFRPLHAVFLGGMGS